MQKLLNVLLAIVFAVVGITIFAFAVYAILHIFVFLLIGGIIIGLIIFLVGLFLSLIDQDDKK
jgi:hypothetical protein